MIYFSMYLQMIVHEAGHFFAAIALCVKVNTVCLGNESIISLKLGKFSISPLCFGGFVDVDRTTFVDKSVFQRLFFFEAGSMTNFIVVGICYFFFQNILSIFIIVVGILYIIGSNTILFPNSDIVCFIKNCKDINHK